MSAKILPLFAIIACITFPSNAQINAGKYLIGGYFNGYDMKNSESSLGSKIQSFNVSLQLGKAVKENTVIGAVVSYGDYKMHAISSPDSNLSKNSQISVGVFYRKYKRLVKDLYFFAEIDAAYTHRENSQVYYINGYGIKNTSDGGTVSLIPGVSYSICKRMQLELLMVNILNLSYSHEKTEYPLPAPARSPDKGNVLAFNANLNSNLLSNFGVGFKFLLGK